jgi:transketolase
LRDVFIKRLCERADADERIVLITGDLGFSVLNEYRERFPKQFFNAGIAEQNMIGMATGLAMEGHIVIAYSIANFHTIRCLEQIRNDACYHEANVKIVAIGGGFSYGQLGVSHHATEDLSIMRSIPNLSVLSPCGFWETERATDEMLDAQGTVYLRLDKSHGCDTTAINGNEPFIIGKSRVLKNGFDCSILVTGGILEEVWDVATNLKKFDIDARVISVPSLKPFDHETVINACRETKIIITVEEHSIQGGLGSIVAEVLMDKGVTPKKFLRIGLEAGFSCIVGSQAYLRKRYGLDAQAITNKVVTLISDGGECSQ